MLQHMVLNLYAIQVKMLSENMQIYNNSYIDVLDK